MRAPQAGRTLAIALVVLLVLGLSALSYLYWREAPSPGPLVEAASPTGSPQSPAGPGAAPTAGLAEDLGPMGFNELLQGVLMLQKSPHPPSEEQIRALADVIQGRNPGQNAGCYVRLVVTDLLTDPQKADLSRRFDELRSAPGYIYHPPGREDQARCYDFLLGRAGGADVEALEVPDGFICEDVEGAKPVPYADLLVQFHSEVDQDPTLRISEEEARRLLPSFKKYKGISYTEESLILGVLTAEQKAWLDEHRNRIPPQPLQQRAFEQAIIRLAGAKP